MPRTRPTVYIALVVLALAWGYTWVAIKVATQDASPLFVAGGRMAIATVILFAILAATGRSLKPTPFVPTVVLGLLQTTGWTLLQTLAVAQAGAGKSAVQVAAGISWAASAVYAKRLRARYDVELLSLTTWQLLYGTIPLVGLILLFPAPVHVTGSFLAAMAFISIGGAALGWFLWMFATPVVGVLAAAIQLHEIPSPAELTGMVLIVVALVVNVLSTPPSGTVVPPAPVLAEAAV